MNRRIIELVTLLCLIVTFLSCHTSKTGITATDIPYTVAQRYFLKNDVHQLPPRRITDRETFDTYFGAAAVMGANGRPTTIDFATNDVIAVVLPATDQSTTLTPISLRHATDGTIIFTYQATRGERLSYSTTPCLLILVDKSQQGDVRLNEQ